MADATNAKNGNAGGIQAYSVGAPVPKGTRRLHLNEFRYSHSPRVIEALQTATSELGPDALLTHYSSGTEEEGLVPRLARYVGHSATKDNIVVAAGSDEILRAVIDTCGLRGHKKLLMGVPGYTHFEHYARLHELEIIRYSIVGPAISISHAEHMAALLYHDRMLAEGCLVYLCSPNNPTGDIWPKDAVDTLACKYPKSFFLIDEAYIEFVSAEESAWTVQHRAYREEDYAAIASAMNHSSAVSVALSRPNVVVARTMSKAFGLASLRIGYAVAAAGTIATLQIAVSPKAFGPIAARIACAALDDLGHYIQTTLETRQQAVLAVRTLRKFGWMCVDGKGNFYLVYVGDPTSISEKLAEQGIRVRNRDDLPGLSGLVRITAGTSTDTAAVVAAFGSLDKPLQPPIQSFYAPKTAITEIKSLLRSVVSILEAEGVEHWAQGGTMLGIVRHEGGIMQWDDDADLAYSLGPSGEDAVGSLVAKFAAGGLTLQRNRTGAYWQVGTNPPGFTISPIHIDIFSYSLEGMGDDARYVLGDPRFREEEPTSARAHCNTKYKPDELFPLKIVRFYDYYMRIPHKSSEVLARSLGADYNTIAKIRTGGPDSETCMIYEIRDKTPA
jgi:histidinol-phosphate aminotransferase